MNRAHDQEDEKKLKELVTLVRDQETQIQIIQSAAFQLASYYFVFQGVILTAICNASTSLKCSDAWFLFTVSLLAASLNLVALASTGLKYIRIVGHRDRNWNECNEITRRLLTYYQSTRPSTTSLSSRSTPSFVTARPFFSPTPPPEYDPSYRSAPPTTQFGDRFRELERKFWFGVCIFLFLSFTGVTLFGCWHFVCKNDHESEDIHKCIKFCAVEGSVIIITNN